MKEKDFQKTDQEKCTYDLVPLDLMWEVDLVLKHGAKKYGVLNWQRKKGFKFSRCYNALLRHMFAWWRGQETDPETGLTHLSHAMCNLLFLMYHSRFNSAADDRPNEEKINESRTN